MQLIDSFLNKITMYRLVLYYLLVVLGAAFCFSFFGYFAFSPIDLVFSALLILSVGWLTNSIFAKAFQALPGTESVYITVLILILIVSPVAPTSMQGVGFLIFATAWAMASKYIFALHKKHFFNPAAFGVALAAPLLGISPSWWVGGTMPLMAFVVLGGLLIVRKIKRFDLVSAFVVVALLTISLTSGSSDFLTPLRQALLHTPFFFLAFVMLTEPLTTPPTRGMRIVYGALVGVLFAPNIHVGSFYLTPELALLIGNLFVFFVSPKGRAVLTLVEKKEIAADTFEFSFIPDRPFAFKPGQYLEWTVPHAASDSRGNRRYFTIASSPQERHIRLGVKFNEQGSTFKKALKDLPVDAKLSATQLAGDFVLPKNKKQKLAFIAGGIGITPFRSHVKHLIGTDDRRSIVLLYGAKRRADLAYTELFAQAQTALGMKTVYALSEEAQVPGTQYGFIDRALIEKEIPDYREHMFYLSGPRAMVDAFLKTLKEMGVSRRHIKTDYFPGFA